MKKLIYLIVVIVAFGLIVSGCIPVVPPTEQSDTGNLTKGTTINVPANYGTIQAAIDAASDGDTIIVNEGTYTECIVIDGVDLTLVAVGNVTIVAPVPVCSGHGDTIQIYNSTCTIDGFTVKGGKGGIYARGMYEGETEVDVTICNNTVVEYLKNGITVNGDLAICRIYNNTVIGGGPLGYPHYAQNGIQIGFGATGTIHGNTVDGNWYTGTNWAASGILIFEADDVTVEGNRVNNSETGIAIEAWGWILPSANWNKIVRNTIDNAEWGISVVALGYYPDASANNNKVVNNTIKTGGIVGIYVYPWYGATAENNKIIHNKISGYTWDICTDEVANKVHANVIE